MLINRRNLIFNISLIVTFLMLLSRKPFIFSCFPFIPTWQIFYLISSVGMIIILLIRRNIILGNKFILTYCLINIIISIFYVIHFETAIYISEILMLFLFYLCWIFTNNQIGVSVIIKIFIYTITGMAVLGAITFMLVLISNIPPIFNYVSIDGRIGYCFGLTCTNSLTGSIMRYSGFFDEPGTMALWGIYALLLNKLEINNKKIEISLIVCLIFTFSLYYFIALIFYLLFFYLNSIKKLILYISAILIILTIIYNLKDSEYSLIYTLTFKRIEKNDSGEFKGDNRSELMYKAKNKFLAAPILGVGAKEFSEDEFMGSNPITPLARDGILRTLSLYLFLIMMFIFCLRNKRSMLKYVFILTIGYAQRPMEIDVYTIYINFLIFYSITNNSALNKINNKIKNE